tara:strand:- start:8150 stop:8359 length:210 start_codon:yes stop_codon:yes gene_type:complete
MTKSNIDACEGANRRKTPWLILGVGIAILGYGLIEPRYVAHLAAVTALIIFFIALIAAALSSFVRLFPR